MTLTNPPHGPASPPRPPARTARPSIMQRAAAERTRTTIGRRRVINVVMVGVTFAAALVATLPLIFIVAHLLEAGASSINSDFFTQIPKPPGEAGGGMANAMVGTVVLILAASVFGLPIGIGAGLYLAENRGTRLANAVRFLSDVLNGLPSIVMGIFAWQFLVKPMGKFTALAGGIALGAMMIPLVTRTTEEMIRIVPVSLREAALALGYSRWRTSLVVVLRTALPGIVTGALVAVSRIAGETAPLVFSASCPHLGCNVTFDQADKVFRCPCHGAQFNAHGEVIRGPVSSGLRKIPFEVKDGKIVVSTEI